MLDTSARLLRLLATLQAQRRWGGPELAERLEITERTLRRDVDRLRSLGYVIESSTGVGGGYQLAPGNTIAPLTLDDDELVAMALALATATASSHGIERPTLTLLAKVEQSLGPRHRKRLRALQTTIVSLGQRATVAPTTLALIASACRDHLSLSFAYTAHDRARTQREVEPLRLAHTGNQRWYLIAFDRAREDWRTFRVDRMSAASMGAPFAPRAPPLDPEQMLSKAITQDAYRFRVRAYIREPLAALQPRVAPWVGTLTALSEHRTALDLGASTIDALASHLLLCGVAFEKIEPDSLREPLLAAIDRVRAGLAPRRVRAKRAVP
ncbi:MAG: WYL domain-containing protein [Myxococcales bacterium]|nr:WYL domain-containing protein [Myxococcales bacterium]